MILVIDGKTYPAVTIGDLSLRHTLELQRELVTTNISSARTWVDVQALLQEFTALPDDQRATHPEALFLSALTIWATRVSAGEQLSLLEAVDIPASSVQWVKEPTDPDHEEPEGKAPARPKTGGAATRTRKQTSTPQ